jgi:hypothetical protein
MNKLDDREISVQTEVPFNQEMVSIIRHYYWLLIAGPILVGIIAYSVAGLVTSKYTSDALLRIDRATSRSMESLVTSPGIADRVLSKFRDTGDGPEARVRYLRKNLAIVDLDPSADRMAAHLFRLEVTHTDPKVAQEIGSQLIDAWLTTTLPGPAARADLEADLQRNKLSSAAYSDLIQKLQKEAVNLVMPNTMSGEIATPISILNAKRDESLAAVKAIENKLAGIPRDVIEAAPHLPQEASWPNKRSVAVLSAALSLPAIFLLILLGNRLRPRRRA